MVLVTSMMTTKEMTDTDIQKALQIVSSNLNGIAKASKYKYNDRQYFEVDIDLQNIEFTKDTLYDGIQQLILTYEQILNTLHFDIDFIAANDDTETEILRYEKDSNAVKDFGLFVTTRCIPNIEPFYSSDICNAYVNLTHVSFGVY